VFDRYEGDAARMGWDGCLESWFFVCDVVEGRDVFADLQHQKSCTNRLLFECIFCMLDRWIFSTDIQG
jgi:hypothetical protein